MAEPQAAAGGFLAALAAVAATISPALAEWVSPMVAEALVILVGAFGGAFLAVMDRDTPHQLGALGVWARGFVMACMFTGLCAVLVAAYGPDQLRASLYPVLLAIAAAIAWKQEGAVKWLAKMRQGAVTTKGKR